MRLFSMGLFNIWTTLVCLLATSALALVVVPPADYGPPPIMSANPGVIRNQLQDWLNSVSSLVNNPALKEFWFSEAQIRAMTGWNPFKWNSFFNAVGDFGSTGADIYNLGEGIGDLVPGITKLPELGEATTPEVAKIMDTLTKYPENEWEFATQEGWKILTKDPANDIAFGSEWGSWEGIDLGADTAVVEGVLDAESLIPGTAAGVAPVEQLVGGSLEVVGSNIFGEAVEIPIEALGGMATMTTEGLIVGAEGVEAAGLLAESAAGAAIAAEVGAQGAVEGSVLAVEGGLLAMGPASLGVAVAAAAAMAAAGFMIMPLINSLKDNRKTVTLHGFVCDIDGDGKPEKVNDFMSKLTPGNTFLYHKESGMQAFFNHLFKKKEKMTFDFSDEAMGHVSFSWKGDAWANQNTVVAVLEDSSIPSAEEKALKILEILESPNHGGNKIHDKIEIMADTDHDGIPEYIKIKYKGRNEHDGKLKIKGDIDGDGINEKCKWHDDEFKGCKHDD